MILVKYLGGYMEKKKVNRKKNTNVQDKIYFYVFSRPFYKGEISYYLYGEKAHPTLIKTIKDLEKKDWVKVYKYNELTEYWKDIVFDKEDFNRVGKRFYNRDFVLANKNILVDRLIKRLNKHDIFLESDEKEEFARYIKGKNFGLEMYLNLLKRHKNCNVEINDIFQYIINFIIVKCVFWKNSYDFKNQLEEFKNLCNHSKEKHYDSIDFFYSKHPFSFELTKKLINLDPYFSSALESTYTVFAHEYYIYKEVMRKMARGVSLDKF